jgi:hypothetical protein
MAIVDGASGSVATRTFRVTPRSWYSWDFAVDADGERIADIDVSWWRERGVLTVRGQEYPVYREGMVSGAFVLEKNGSVLARAEKPSAFRRWFHVDHAGTRWTLRAQSALRRSMVVLSGELEVGAMKPDSAFRRSATVTLPKALPDHVSVFLIWLAIVLWKREADSAAAGAFPG